MESQNKKRKIKKVTDATRLLLKKKITQYYRLKDKKIMKELPFEKWSRTLRRKYFLNLKGHKCEDCKFSWVNSEGKGPYQIHHKDGDNKNNKLKNLKLLCLNCHWKTDNFAFRGKKHSNKTKKILADIQKKS